MDGFIVTLSAMKQKKSEKNESCLLFRHAQIRVITRKPLREAIFDNPLYGLVNLHLNSYDPSPVRCLLLIEYMSSFRNDFFTFAFASPAAITQQPLNQCADFPHFHSSFTMVIRYRFLWREWG
jgi:hypothetical protein